MSPIIQVAVAVITDPQQRILITQRSPEVPHPGLWEFPGGKLDANELASDALIREIREEVGLTVLNYKFITQIDHQYPDKSVSLLVFQVNHFQGTAACLEAQQDLRWVKKAELKNYQFPTANLAILNHLQLTDCEID